MALRTREELRDFTIGALDGDIGLVNDVYFDDEKWTVRYIVVDAGVVLSRRVLISPRALRDRCWGPLHLWVDLTIEQVEHSPGIDLDKPVSRQHEAEYHDHFGYPYYWHGSHIWGAGPHPKSRVRAGEYQPPRTPSAADTHLRSAKEVTGYHVTAMDGEIGHIADLVFDDGTWEIRYLVIATSNWWFGKKVLLPPQWAEKVSWAEKSIHVNLSRQIIKDGPEWPSNEPISREYEDRLHGYYGRPGYWT